MGASDRFYVTVTGIGGHASMPQGTVDAIVVASHIIVALQTIISRNTDPLDSAVVTIGGIHGGEAPNVICKEVKFCGTVRALKESSRLFTKQRVIDICKSIGVTFGATVDIDYRDG